MDYKLTEREDNMPNDNGKISVILCSSGKEAEIVEIEDSLEEMMNIVGGQIEEYMPFEDDVVIVCNADGKMNGLPMNRTIRDESGAILDVVNGDFFICYGPFESETFLSLPEDLANKYLEEYRWPEQVFLRNGVVSRAIKYNPGYREKEVAMLSGVREYEGNYEALEVKAPLINRETLDNFNVKEEFLQEEKTEDR